MRRLLFVLCMMIVAAGGCNSAVAAKKKRTVKSVKTEQQAAQKRIKETTRKIKDNEQKTEQTLARLNLLRGEISQKETQIMRTQSEVESIDRNIAQAQDSLNVLNDRLSSLRTTYLKALRKLQGNRQFTNELAYIFSAESFSVAMARIRYVREFGKWRKRKAREIAMAAAELGHQKDTLEELHSRRSASLNTLSADQAVLKVRQAETDRMVASLKSDGASLKKALEKEQQRLNSIDAEITRMIEAERQERERQEKLRKEKEKKNSGKKTRKKETPESKGSQAKGTKPAQPESGAKSPSKATAPKSHIDNSDPDAVMSQRFASAKGSMGFPVTGPYRIVGKFGASAGQPYNTGIEIVLDGSANARSVFDGTVSRIFQNHDGNYSVMVRHGAYITVFYNVGSLSVKAKDKVKAGQTIGRVAVDPRYGKPMLHFEVRKGSQTLNPQSWVK